MYPASRIKTGVNFYRLVMAAATVTSVNKVFINAHASSYKVFVIFVRLLEKLNIT